MKILLSVFLALFCLACDKGNGPQVDSGVAIQKDSDHSKKELNLDDKSIVGGVKERLFEIPLGKEIIKGKIDSGVITIDYPSEFYGSIKLLRFDGSTKPNVQPFSQSHCDDIRSLAKHRAGLLVRTAYYSVLSFEIPVVTSSSFVAELTKKSKSLGYSIPELTISNPIIYYQGTAKVVLDESSISRSIGNDEYLEAQLNLSTKGTDIDLSHKKLIVISGDIICDLASKLARIEMTYPIKGDNKNIKVVFDTLDLSMTL